MLKYYIHFVKSKVHYCQNQNGKTKKTIFVQRFERYESVLLLSQTITFLFSFPIYNSIFFDDISVPFLATVLEPILSKTFSAGFEKGLYEEDP